jgi:hypothetical protein
MMRNDRVQASQKKILDNEDPGFMEYSVKFNIRQEIIIENGTRTNSLFALFISLNGGENNRNDHIDNPTNPKPKAVVM